MFAFTNQEGVEVSKVMAKWDYEAQQDTHLSFKAGDVIEVILQDVGFPGWWHGSLNSGKEGIFPNNYVVVVEILQKKKKMYKISQKNISSKIQRLRSKLASNSNTFAETLANEKKKEEPKPVALPPSPQPSRIASTVARRKKIRANRDTVISFFGAEEEDNTANNPEKSNEATSDSKDTSNPEKSEENEDEESEEESESETETENSEESVSGEYESESESGDSGLNETSEEATADDTSTIESDEPENIKIEEKEVIVGEPPKENIMEPVLSEIVVPIEAPIPIPVAVDGVETRTPPASPIAVATPPKENSPKPPIEIDVAVNVCDEEGQVPKAQPSLLMRCFERCSVL